MTDRKDILLRAAFDLIRLSEMSHYVEPACNTLIRYDEANCDGSCLKNDIADLLEIDPETNPIALGSEDDAT